MEGQNHFTYTYSAPENQEVLMIRKKYLPREESKFDELKRLDRAVQSAGTVQALCAGIGGTLVFGLGMCLSMEIIGSAVWLGVLLGAVGALGMITAFPVHKGFLQRAKERHVPRILQLTEELAGNF